MESSQVVSAKDKEVNMNIGDSIQCPACNHQPVEFLFRATDVNRRVSDESFSYCRCPICQLVFLTSILVDMPRYYAESYYEMPSSLEQLSSIAEHDRYRLELVQNFVPKGRLIDVGASYGRFAHLANESGYQVEAIEMDDACCKFLTDIVGVNAHCTNNMPMALREIGPSNVITLWHVIEHLSDPWTTIEAGAEQLQSGGIMVLASPNPSAFQFQIFGRSWAHLDAPRHLQLIPIPLLVDRARNFNLMPVLVTLTDEGTLMLNRFGWQKSLMNMFVNQSAKYAVRIVGRILSSIFSPIERRGTRGSNYVVVFQKD